MSTHYCRVCGLYIDNKPWGDDGYTPSFEICPCCGAEFGYDDYNVQLLKEYRRKWIDGGYKWTLPEEKSLNWNVKEQIENISEEFM